MDYNLCDSKTINRLLSAHGFKFSKALGQNFIVDEEVCPAMAKALCANKKTLVIEIGPGIGVLTKELCRVAGRVCAIELDKRLYPLLGETLGDYKNFELVEGDVMKLDLKKLIEEKSRGFTSVKICANLPYYITSPVIMLLLESRLPVDEIIVMVQREAADRLCAEAGTRNSGAVSAAVQYYGSSEILFDVGRESFMPSPKVDSAVIKITPYTQPKYSVKNEKAFFTLVKAAFSQRRKTAVNSVSATLKIPKERVASALRELSLDENIRAEKLTMEDFAALSETLVEPQKANEG